MNFSNEKILNILIVKQPSKNFPEPKEKYQKYIGMLLDYSNIASFCFKPDNPITSIEYLSLENNSISDISFIRHLPNLFYLDLYKNSIADFEPLNYKNLFGFLRISVEQFNEKKVLSLRQLNVGIVKLEIEDKSYIKLFLLNNPNIMLLNDDIVYYYKDSVIRRDTRKLIKLSTIVRTAMSDNSVIQHNDKNLKGNPVLYDEIDIHTLSCKHINIIKKYFDNYSNRIYHLNPRVNEVCDNDNYLQLEREKLIMISYIYGAINQYNKMFLNESAFYISSRLNEYKSSLRKMKDNYYSAFEFSYIFKGNLNCVILILISYLFFILGISSKDLSITIIHFIINHYYVQLKDNQLIFEIPLNLHNIAVYFDIYKQFKTFYDKKTYQHNSNPKLQKDITQEKKYKRIIHALDMHNLVLKGNFITSNLKDNNKGGNSNNNNKYLFSQKRMIIKEKIAILTELKIKNDVLILIQYLFDFLIYDKVEDQLYSSKCSNDYAFLIEFKDSLYQHSDISFTLSDKKYQRNQIDSFNNVFYFKRENAENLSKAKKNPIINSNLFEFPHKETPNRTITPNKLFASSNSPLYMMSTRRKEKRLNKKHHNDFFNYDDEYLPVNAFDSNECLKISQVQSILYCTGINKYKAKHIINSQDDSSEYYKSESLPIISKSTQKTIKSQNKLQRKFIKLKKNKSKDISNDNHTKQTKRTINIKNDVYITNELSDERGKKESRLSKKKYEDRNYYFTEGTNNSTIPNFVKVMKKGKIRLNLSKARKNYNLDQGAYITVKDLSSFFHIQNNDESKLYKKHNISYSLNLI